MEIILIFVAIIAIIIAFLIGWKVAIHPDKVSNETLLQERKELELKINTEKEQIQTLKNEKERLNKEYEKAQKYVQDAEKSAETIYNSKRKELDLRYEKDKVELDKKLQEKENIFNQKLEQKENALKQREEKANEDYSKRQETYAADIEKTKEELESLKATKAAAIEAARKEQLISQNQEDYCLRIPVEEQNDVSILKSVRNRITKPRAVSMVIWSHYYQPMAKKLFPKILGEKIICGVYKITNQQTGECYIGQATDVRRRWIEHTKCGLSIDTPQGNKLYKAMQDYGIDNFSFELLEQCTTDRLNEKEKYFINLYSADTLGYNSNKGVGK